MSCLCLSLPSYYSSCHPVIITNTGPCYTYHWTMLHTSLDYIYVYYWTMFNASHIIGPCSTTTLSWFSLLAKFYLARFLSAPHAKIVKHVKINPQDIRINCFLGQTSPLTFTLSYSITFTFFTSPDKCVRSCKYIQIQNKFGVKFSN